MRLRPFLTAEWRYLAMLNFEVEPTLLRPLVPTGTQLDDWQGRTFLSVVGLLFLNTRVFSMTIPFHRNFEEVNLRFYVRRRMNDGWRRGVVFVKELVPRTAIALTARLLYGENYLALPMNHGIEFENGHGDVVRRVFYHWKFNGHENQIEMNVEWSAHEIDSGSEEEFITEHYWGCTRQKDGVRWIIELSILAGKCGRRGMRGLIVIRRNCTVASLLTTWDHRSLPRFWPTGQR